MKIWNTDKLLEQVAEAGAIALKYYASPEISVKSDYSVVTKADIEIEDFFSKVYDRPNDNIYLIGEETLSSHDENYIEEALKNNAIIIDPIDGTAPYTAKIPVWGISIALMQKGILTEGMIYMPVEDTVYFSKEGKMYCCHNLQK